MLKALGIGKYKSATSAEIEKYQKASFQCEQWSEHVTYLQGILNTLAASYRESKKQIPLTRYGAMKTAIKTAVQQFSTGEEQFVKRPLERKEQHEATGGSPITNLLQNSEALLSQMETRQQFEDTTEEEINAEIERMRKTLIHLKQEYYYYRDRLRELQTGYEDSKQYQPTERYGVLKSLTKEATAPKPG